MLTRVIVVLSLDGILYPALRVSQKRIARSNKVFAGVVKVPHSSIAGIVGASLSTTLYSLYRKSRCIQKLAQIELDPTSIRAVGSVTAYPPRESRTLNLRGAVALKSNRFIVFAPEGHFQTRDLHVNIIKQSWNPVVNRCHLCFNEHHCGSHVCHQCIMLGGKF